MTARQARRRRAGAGLVALGLLSLVLAEPGAPSPTRHSQEYRGDFVDYRTGGVSFRVLGKEGTPRVRFRAKNVFIACEDQEGRRITFDPITVRFTGARAFEGARYSLAPSGKERYYGVGGRLSPGGRARGFVVFFSNVPQPGPHDCSTEFGKVVWKAKR